MIYVDMLTGYMLTHHKTFFVIYLLIYVSIYIFFALVWASIEVPPFAGWSLGFSFFSFLFLSFLHFS
jgi:hypothetical protein